ncbi:hypothetical protein NPA07_03905 [Mycoplasmopsis caviae]|uniref:Uncharacterized protein n=1 Tax=Mycoplasmopsis caviae TaxID=55603 RepID=A0A3P8LIH2_9BACT|nr:hypothetical protein [Mycoplasmopsis caviae]UUD34929.1 hypothetical protein NPA07_03905 [Mycoplasmopsis caviae]VDR42242.1 Uncharacterised protein [Mycoplasmopsis caviae]
MQTSNSKLKDSVIASSDNLLICNNGFLLKSYAGNKIELSTILRLMQAFNNSILNKHCNILLSYEGSSFDSDNFKYIASYFIQKGHIVFNYHNCLSTNLILDEFAYKKGKYDFLIKFNNIINNHYLEVKILDNNFELLNTQVQENIYNYYQNNSWENQEIKLNSPILINEFELIDELTSNEQMLKAFTNVKQRYKTLSYFAYDNDFSKRVGSELLNNYQCKFISNNKNISLSRLKWLSFFATRSLYYKQKIQNIFHFDNNSNLSVCLRLSEKFKWLNSHELVLIYLDFFLEEIKRNGIDITNSFVIVPQNTTFQILELLKQYKVKYYYYDPNGNSKLLKSENCLFAYIENKYIANPRFSNQFNNYYFFICLIWMLNSYTNRNNLLSFKHNQLSERVGKVKIFKKSYKFQFDKIDNLLKYFSLNYKRWFVTYNAYKVWNDNKYMLFKLINNRKHQAIFYWDDIRERLVVEYQMCSHFEDISNSIWIDKIKLQILLYFLIKQSNSSKFTKSIKNKNHP